MFTTERLTPMTTHGFRKTLSRIGQAAALPFPVHPHMLRHACGYELQRAGLPTRVIQAWMGHSDIRHTVRYTESLCGAVSEGVAGERLNLPPERRRPALVRKKLWITSF